MPEQGDATGWQVWPGQAAEFRAAVGQVRAQLNALLSQASELTGPAYQPQLGDNPVGNALAAKFADRISGGQGMLTYLNAALADLDQFVTEAERTAARYTEADRTAET